MNPETYRNKYLHKSFSAADLNSGVNVVCTLDSLTPYMMSVMSRVWVACCVFPRVLKTNVREIHYFLSLPE